jgi:hypothetical protein
MTRTAQGNQGQCHLARTDKELFVLGKTAQDKQRFAE